MKPISRNEFNTWVQANGGYLATNFWTYFWFDQARQLKALILRAVEALEKAADGAQGPPPASKRPYSKPAMVCLDVPSETNERVRFLIELPAVRCHGTQKSRPRSRICSTLRRC